MRICICSAVVFFVVVPAAIYFDLMAMAVDCLSFLFFCLIN